VWAAGVEIYLVGVLLGWRVEPSMAVHPGYGALGSVALLVVSMLVTIAGAVAVVDAVPLSRTTRLTIAACLAIVAVGVIPMAVSGFFAPRSDGVLLAASVVGMECLAAYLFHGARVTSFGKRGGSRS